MTQQQQQQQPADGGRLAPAFDEGYLWAEVYATCRSCGGRIPLGVVRAGAIRVKVCARFLEKLGWQRQEGRFYCPNCLASPAQEQPR